MRMQFRLLCSFSKDCHKQLHQPIECMLRICSMNTCFTDEMTPLYNPEVQCEEETTAHADSTLRCLKGKKTPDFRVRPWVRCSFLCVNLSLAMPQLSSLNANASKMVVFVGRADSFCIPSDSLLSSAAHCHSL